MTELAAQRRSLEQVVLELTGPGADRVDADRADGTRRDRGRARLLLRRRRVWLCWALLCALPALVAVLLAVTEIVPPPGRGGEFLSAVVSNGQLFPAAALALVLPVFLPITVAIVPGTRSPARRAPAPCATCWSARSGGCGCWSRSWSR